MATRPAPAGSVGAAAPRRGMRHVPALDGLRGAALVGVLLYHGGMLKGAYQSVDVFFALSGYLITALLLVEARDRKGVSLSRFWSRRSRRLIPGLLFFLVGIAAFARFVASPFQWTAIRGDGLATLFYVANWHSIFSGDTYGSGIGGRSPMEHTWSLAIEEQFYILWPLLVVGLLRVRRSPKLVLQVAVGATIVSSALLIGLSFTSVSFNSLYLGTHTRLAAIALGSAVAAWRASYGAPRSAAGRRAVDGAAWVGVGVLALMWGWLPLESPVLYHGAMTAGVVSAVAILASVSRPGAASTPMSKVLSWAPFQWLGQISYGMYLWHWPVFVWLDEPRTGLDGWTLFALRIAVSTLMANVSLYAVENPIRKGALPGRQALYAAFGGVAVVGLLLVAATSGGPGSPLEDEASTRTGAPVGPQPVLAVYGDSVGSFLVRDALVPEAERLGYTGVFGGDWGCQVLGALPGRDGNGILPASKDHPCTDIMDETLGELSAPPAASMVVFGGVAFDVQIDGTWRGPCEPEYREAYAQELSSIIRRVAANGAPVTLVSPASIPSTLVERTLAMDDVPERMTCLREAVADAAEETGAGLVDLDAHLCSGPETCDEVLPDNELRKDGLHFTHERAVLVADWLVPEAVAAARPVRG